VASGAGGSTLALVFMIVGSILACAGIIYVSIVVKKYLNNALEEEQLEEE
jgi:hypothetical protein